MNKQTFANLIKNEFDGEYGRKVAYTDYPEVTSDNVVEILNKTLPIFNKNCTAIKYLWTYYLGDQPVLYRNKTVRDDVNNPVVENHAYETVQFKVGQTYGEPLMCVSLAKDDKVNEAVDKLNGYLRAGKKYVKDVTCGEWQSAVGTAYKAIQRKKGDIPFRIVVPSPLDTYIVYNSSTQEPLCSVQRFKDKDGIYYYQVFSEYEEFIIKNDTLTILAKLADDTAVYSRVHAFGGIPIVEYPNNSARLSDIEIVSTMFDAINELQSNRTDAIQQFVQSFFKFVNCDIDENLFSRMKELGAVVVNSVEGEKNAEVGLITQEMNQTEGQVVKKDLCDNAMVILAIPNREGNTGGDTAGAVSLRNGWDSSRLRANIKDAYVKDSDKDFVMLILNRIRQEKGASECPLGTLDFEINIPHSPTDNLYVKSESLKMLLDSGIHPLVAIKASGIWTDAEKVFLNSKPYLDVLHKTIDEVIAEQSLEAEVEKAKGLINNGDTTV